MQANTVQSFPGHWSRTSNVEIAIQNRGSTAMKLLVLCTIFGGLAADILAGRLVSVARWQEGISEPEILMNQDDVLENGNALYTEKRPPRLEGLIEQTKRMVVPDEPTVRTRSLSSCMCETLYEIKDLGDGHYPRYLTASRCKPKACHTKFNACRLLHYRVHVLSQRDVSGIPEDEYQEEATLPESPLPEPLRQNWQLRPLSVAVACIPSTAGRRT